MKIFKSLAIMLTLGMCPLSASQPPKIEIIEEEYEENEPGMPKKRATPTTVAPVPSAGPAIITSKPSIATAKAPSTPTAIPAKKTESKATHESKTRAESNLREIIRRPQIADLPPEIHYNKGYIIENTLTRPLILLPNYKYEHHECDEILPIRLEPTKPGEIKKLPHDIHEKDLANIWIMEVDEFNKIYKQHAEKAKYKEEGPSAPLYFKYSFCSDLYRWRLKPTYKFSDDIIRNLLENAYAKFVITSKKGFPTLEIHLTTKGLADEPKFSPVVRELIRSTVANYPK